MKSLLVVFVLTILLCSPLSGQEVGDTDYWERDLSDSSGYYINKANGHFLPHSARRFVNTSTYSDWQRIPDRWTIKVDTMTIFIKNKYAMQYGFTPIDTLEQKRYFIKENNYRHIGITSPFQFISTYVDTTCIPKQPVFLDSADYKKLMNVINPSWVVDSMRFDGLHTLERHND